MENNPQRTIEPSVRVMQEPGDKLRLLLRSRGKRLRMSRVRLKPSWKQGVVKAAERLFLGKTSIRDLAILVILLVLVVIPLTSRAQAAGEPTYQGMPYGHSCPEGGGSYGRRKPVHTPEQAKHMIETSFSRMGKTVFAGKIEEKELYFAVEVLNREGVVTDRVIVDKRTGRMRSIY
jgi:hypothetical protein